MGGRRASPPARFYFRVRRKMRHDQPDPLRKGKTFSVVDTRAVGRWPVGQAFKTKHIDAYWAELTIVRASPTCVHYVSVCENCSACGREAGGDPEVSGLLSGIKNSGAVFASVMAEVDRDVRLA